MVHRGRSLLYRMERKVLPPATGRYPDHMGGTISEALLLLLWKPLDRVSGLSKASTGLLFRDLGELLRVCPG